MGVVGHSPAFLPYSTGRPPARPVEIETLVGRHHTPLAAHGCPSAPAHTRRPHPARSRRQSPSSTPKLGDHNPAARPRRRCNRCEKTVGPRGLDGFGHRPELHREFSSGFGQSAAESRRSSVQNPNALTAHQLDHFALATDLLATLQHASDTEELKSEVQVPARTMKNHQCSADARNPMNLLGYLTLGRGAEGRCPSEGITVSNRINEISK